MENGSPIWISSYVSCSDLSKLFRGHSRESKSKRLSKEGNHLGLKVVLYTCKLLFQSNNTLKKFFFILFQKSWNAKESNFYNTINNFRTQEIRKSSKL